MEEMAGRILVGTSSWADPGFVEDWYPKGLAARDRLGWYAQRFEYVEVNSSFYAIPAEKTVARWAEITPERFTRAGLADETPYSTTVESLEQASTFIFRRENRQWKRVEERF